MVIMARKGCLYIASRWVPMTQLFEPEVARFCLIWYPKPMHFVSEGVCVMRYCGPMRYALHFPANQVGGHIELCVIRGYAFSEVWVMRGSTVSHSVFFRVNFPAATGKH
jgi:hypothetical protein